MTSEKELRKLFEAALGTEEAKGAAPGIPAAEPAESRTAPSAAAPAVAAGLDDETSDELGRLLDERHARAVRRDRRSRWIGLATMLALLAGGGAWAAANPERMANLKQCVADLRKAGDVKAIAAEYQESLDKIAARGGQIDDATRALGQTPEARAEAPRLEAP